MKGNNLERVLLSFPRKPDLLVFLEAAFNRRGIKVEMTYPDENHWFDRHVIHKTNKLFHNLRLLPKSKALFSGHPLVHKNYRSFNLLRKYREFQPDLVLLVRGPSFNYEPLAEIAAKTALFGWWIEMESRMEEAFREMQYFDWYYFINSACIEKGHGSGYSSIGLLQHAVDTEAFYKIENSTKDIDLCFVGNWSHKRQSYIDALIRVTGNIAIYGNKWLKKNMSNARVRQCIKGRYIDGHDLVEVYNRSRIVVNITNWGSDASSTRSGINMRVLEAPATGSFLLTDGSIDMDKMAIPGKHAAIYDDLEDCVRQAKYYLNNPAEREVIADEGYRHVLSQHTYDDVVKEIVDKYAELFNAKIV